MGDGCTEWIWGQRKIISTEDHRPVGRWCGSQLALSKSIFNRRRVGFNKWQWWGSQRKSIVKSILTVPSLWSMSVVIKYSKASLKKCKAIQDSAVIYLILIPVIYFIFPKTLAEITHWYRVTIFFTSKWTVTQQNPRVRLDKWYKEY